MSSKVIISESSESIERDLEKCIECGICVQTCEKNNGLSDDCINCGQCILSCPTNALKIRSHVKPVFDCLKNPDNIVIVSVSPGVRVAIGDEFGFEPGAFLEGKLVSSLRSLGFSHVLDTTFSADLTVMEEAHELLKRLEENKNLPMFTSCCPSWVLYMEKYHQEDLKHLSSVKSPVGMQSALLKTYFASKLNLNPEKIIHVALTPCVSKKSEIKRPEITGTDYVITTRELAELLKQEAIDFPSLEESNFDSFMGKGSGSGVIFGNSGGVMESALRCAYYMKFKTEAPENFFELTEVRGTNMMKEANIMFGEKTLRVLALSEISQIERMYPIFSNYDFIEVMTCPSGCIGGAGQPKMNKMMLEAARKKRMASLYQNDANSNIRVAYQNPDIIKVYDEFLESPGSLKSEELLHTTFHEMQTLETIEK